MTFPLRIHRDNLCATLSEKSYKLRVRPRAKCCVPAHYPISFLDREIAPSNHPDHPEYLKGKVGLFHEPIFSDVCEHSVWLRAEQFFSENGAFGNLASKPSPVSQRVSFGTSREATEISSLGVPNVCPQDWARDAKPVRDRVRGCSRAGLSPIVP